MLAVGIAMTICVDAKSADETRIEARIETATDPNKEATIDTVAPARQILVMLHLPPPHFRPDASYGGRYTDDLGSSARRRIAEELAQTYGLKVVSDWPMPVLGIDCYVMEEAADKPLNQKMGLIAKDPRVEWVQPMALFHGLGRTDPLYLVQPSAKYWHIDEIHKVATGRNVHVAVVDSGIDDTHPDLLGQITLKENFVDGSPYIAEAHGTGVAGIIAARAGNGGGIEGVAPDARVMALRACWEVLNGPAQCNSFTLAKALNYAITHNAQVINMSLTGPSDHLLGRLVDAALTRGISVVGAVDPHSADHGFPASHPGVLAASDEGAKDNDTAVLIAPGRDIPTAAPGARWHFVSGPSYAAAHVSGMVALLTELQPSLKPAQIRAKMVVNTVASSDAQIAGTIDACATIGRDTGSYPCLMLVKK